MFELPAKAKKLTTPQFVSRSVGLTGVAVQGLTRFSEASKRPPLLGASGNAYLATSGLCDHEFDYTCDDCMLPPNHTEPSNQKGR